VRKAQIAALTSTAGTQIHGISLPKIRMARAENNPPMPMGETKIGLHGKKYRRGSKGEKNATPKPPFVSASKAPWEAVTRNNSNASFPRS
jgi:hypothetical protein